MIGKSKNIIGLLYHDIIRLERADESGFTGGGTHRYTISPSKFRQHLQTIADSQYDPGLVTDNVDSYTVLITFDDGGSSAIQAAEILEEFGFYGHFQIVIDRVGDPGFLSWDEIKSLSKRGHVIGSHTMTHSNLLRASEEKLRYELIESRKIIHDRLGQCQHISIPYGGHNSKVLKEALQAGYPYVFTSEPVRHRFVDTGNKIGRWNIWHHTDNKDLQNILQDKSTKTLPIKFRHRLLNTAKYLLGRKRFICIRDKIL